MRIFGDIERKIIEGLILGHNKKGFLNCLNNLLCKSPELQPEMYFLESNHLAKCLETYTSNEQDKEDYGSPLNNFIMLLKELFEYLESEKLVTFIPLCVDQKSSTPVGKKKEDGSYRVDFLPDDFRKKFYKYISSEIYISQVLINHVQNDYKTANDIRHEDEMRLLRKQLNDTKTAFKVSFSGLVLSIIVSVLAVSVSYWGTLKVNLTTISKNQISEDIKKMSESLVEISTRHNEVAKNFEKISIENVEKLEDIAIQHNEVAKIIENILSKQSKEFSKDRKINIIV